MKEVTIESFLINQYADLDDSTRQQLKEHLVDLRRIEAKKNEIVVRAGAISQHSFFVERGLLRQYSVDNKGREHILHFAPEGWLLSDRESFFFNRPSDYYIETMEDSTIVLLDPKFFSRLPANPQAMLPFNERLLQKHILQLQKRITQLLNASAEERYLNFMKIYPDIVMRVPQWMVASYLGIAPESLSRVRKDLAIKWKNKEK